MVSRGEYGIESATKSGSHYKVTLDNPLGGRTEWYVFEGHMNVLNAGTIVITADTVFKTKPVQSSSLSDDETATVTQRELAVKSYEPRGSHLLVTFVNPIEGRTDWYVFKGHVETMNIEDYPPPQETPQSAPQGQLIRIPGEGQVGTLDSIVEGGNFNWGEATKGGSRIPVNAAVTNNIIAMAKRMDEVRNKLGDRPITITSWYRPPQVNRAVGGARNSTHLRGHGVDFIVSGLSPREVQRELDPWWNGGLGYGHTFTHLDNRGYRARWNYG
ncbi:MAG: DUF882 domain-containing protein [Kamptonema sp. SIO4C4]|nr:DUF882 domain-containing protein [Kamptonema sp. SIO4C4]